MTRPGVARVDGWPQVGGASNGVAVWLLRAVADSVKTVEMGDVLSSAVRGALLVDLCLAGRVEETDSQVRLDTTPTGFGPADAVLAAITAHPDREVSVWLQRGEPPGHVLGDEFVQRGEWTRRHRGLYRRFGVTEQAIGGSAVRRDLARDLRAGQAPNATTASLLCLTAALGLLGAAQRYADIPQPILTQLGDAQQITTSIVTYLQDTQIDDQVLAVFNTDAIVLGGW